MMKTIYILFCRRAFSDVLEGVTSKIFLSFYLHVFLAIAFQLLSFLPGTSDMHLASHRAFALPHKLSKYPPLIYSKYQGHKRQNSHDKFTLVSPLALNLMASFAFMTVALIVSRISTSFLGI